MEDSRPKKVLVALGGGGFAGQTLRLVDLIEPGVELAYAVTKHLHADVDIRIRRKGRVFELSNPGIITWPLWRRIILFFQGIWEARQIVRDYNPDIIIGVGTPMMALLGLWGRIYRIKTAYVETIAMVERKSRTGKIIYKLGLVDRFYVQWPELLKLYPKAIYEGRLI